MPIAHSQGPLLWKQKNLLNKVYLIDYEMNMFILYVQNTVFYFYS